MLQNIESSKKPKDTIELTAQTPRIVEAVDRPFPA
jgi:hypothetical protein